MLILSDPHADPLLIRIPNLFRFRCCAHVTEEEHLYFSSGNNQSSLPKVQQQQPKNTDPDDAALSPLDLG